MANKKRTAKFKAGKTAAVKAPKSSGRHELKAQTIAKMKSTPSSPKNKSAEKEPKAPKVKPVKIAKRKRTSY